MSVNSTLISMVRVLVILGVVSLGACDVRVTEVSKAQGSCIDYQSASADEAFKSIKVAVERHDYLCAEAGLTSAKTKSADRRLVDLSKEIARGGIGVTDPPDTLRVVALGYVLYATHGQDQDVLQERLEVVRKVARTSDEEHRAIAIGVLSTRRSDDDLDIYKAGIESGGEAVLAYSVYALADNCSVSARQLLQEEMRSPQVEAYLKKYEDKESITGIVGNSCKAAMK